MCCAKKTTKNIETLFWRQIQKSLCHSLFGNTFADKKISPILKPQKFVYVTKRLNVKTINFMCVCVLRFSDLPNTKKNHVFFAPIVCIEWPLVESNFICISEAFTQGLKAFPILVSCVCETTEPKIKKKREFEKINYRLISNYYYLCSERNHWFCRGWICVILLPASIENQ